MITEKMLELTLLSSFIKKFDVDFCDVYEAPDRTLYDLCAMRQRKMELEEEFLQPYVIE